MEQENEILRKNVLECEKQLRKSWVRLQSLIDMSKNVIHQYKNGTLDNTAISELERLIQTGD